MDCRLSRCRSCLVFLSLFLAAGPALAQSTASAPTPSLFLRFEEGADRLEKKAAAVAFEVGKGKIVMFGFRVQHRAQSEGTFPMLFNAIQWAGVEEAPRRQRSFAGFFDSER